LGGTIHDVAQVVGAGYSISPAAGDIATYVKLLRVALLLPIVFTMPLFFRRYGSTSSAAKRPYPFFLVGFAALVGFRSAGLLPTILVDLANDILRGCLVAAIAALGMKTSFKNLFAAGLRPVCLLVAETGWIFVLVLLTVQYVL
jgi:uncharacterized membrane protein YadS